MTVVRSCSGRRVSHGVVGEKWLTYVETPYCVEATLLMGVDLLFQEKKLKVCCERKKEGIRERKKRRKKGSWIMMKQSKVKTIWWIPRYLFAGPALMALLHILQFKTLSYFKYGKVKYNIITYRRSSKVSVEYKFLKYPKNYQQSNVRMMRYGPVLLSTSTSTLILPALRPFPFDLLNLNHTRTQRTIIQHVQRLHDSVGPNTIDEAWYFSRRNIRLDSRYAWTMSVTSVCSIQAAI